MGAPWYLVASGIGAVLLGAGAVLNGLAARRVAPHTVTNDANDSSIRGLQALNKALQEDNAQLRKENTRLREELEGFDD